MNKLNDVYYSSVSPEVSLADYCVSYLNGLSNLYVVTNDTSIYKKRPDKGEHTGGRRQNVFPKIDVTSSSHLREGDYAA